MKFGHKTFQGSIKSAITEAGWLSKIFAANFAGADTLQASSDLTHKAPTQIVDIPGQEGYLARCLQVAGIALKTSSAARQ